jgi:hypothetical protein
MGVFSYSQPHGKAQVGGLATGGRVGRVAGRLDARQAERPEYGYLPAAQRASGMLAKPGTIFIAQPDMPVPLAADFPFPA